MRIISLLVILFLAQSPRASAVSDDVFASERSQLIELIEHHVQLTRSYIDKQALNPKVMAVMKKVPRHQFVPDNLQKYAYENRPLAIGHGQTISQPFIVALMTDLLETTPEDTVLEIGTGSGYQAAVLAELVKKVYSLEIIEPLGKEAELRLRRLAIPNIETKIGDGYYGWSEHAPYDAIIVTAASSHIPPPLIGQLKVGGKMIIPVGSGFQTQQLLLITKEDNERVTSKHILPVVFVPLTGSH